MSCRIRYVPSSANASSCLHNNMIQEICRLLFCGGNFLLCEQERTTSRLNEKDVHAGRAKKGAN